MFRSLGRFSCFQRTPYGKQLWNRAEKILPKHPFEGTAASQNLTGIFKEYSAWVNFTPSFLVNSHSQLVIKEFQKKKNQSLYFDNNKDLCRHLQWQMNGTKRGEMPEIVGERDLARQEAIKKDLEQAFQKAPELAMGKMTFKLLLNQLSPLASDDPVKRFAACMALEIHQERTVKVLHGVIEGMNLELSEMKYFTPIGETEHVSKFYREITLKKTADALVQDKDIDHLFKYFDKYYQEYAEWSHEVKKKES